MNPTGKKTKVDEWRKHGRYRGYQVKVSWITFSELVNVTVSWITLRLAG